MKKFLSIILILSLSLSLLAGCNNDDESGGSGNGTADGTTGGTGDLVPNPNDDKVGTGACDYVTSRSTEGHDVKYVKITVKDMGSMVLLLDATTAPVTVANFLSLVNGGFYNGLTFHRIIDDFMIQGGDPNGNGTGGNTDADGNEINIKGEFADNGHANDISHIRGVISMAREGSQSNPAAAYNTASSQFFICNGDASGLDGSYAAFGYVIAGLDVLDKITAEGIKYTNAYYNGTIYDKTKQPIISRITEITAEEAEAVKSTPEIKPECSEYFNTRSTEGRNIKYVKMTVKDHGDIVLLLDATTAPVTVANFLNLVNGGFYNGLTFHRIIDDFMIQGGDPKANGTGGNTDADGNEINIKGEFDNNNHPNDISHIRGVISMARAGSYYDPASAYNTASSQFFICNADSTFLDGDYASFGYVISGLSVVDSITKAGVKANGGNSNGVISVKSDQPVITSITEITEAEALALVK